MWILAIPVGLFSLWGAYLAFKKLVSLRLPPKFAFLLVLGTTAFMVVPWMLPGGIFKLLMAATFLLYLGLGANSAWDWLTRKNRSNGSTVDISATSLDSAAKEQITATCLTLMALADARDPNFCFETGAILSTDPVFAGYAQSELYRRLEQIQNGLATSTSNYDSAFALVRTSRSSQEVSAFARRIRSGLNEQALSALDEAIQ